MLNLGNDNVGQKNLTPMGLYGGWSKLVRSV